MWYDYSVRQHDILHNYLSQEKIVKLNKYNTKALMKVNDVLITYTPILQKFLLISSLLKVIENKLASQWIRINTSLKKQKYLFLSCKFKLKECGITEEQYNAIVYSVDKFQKRLLWIETHILPEYFVLTPLKEYEEKLNAEGNSLDSILNEYIKNHKTNDGNNINGIDIEDDFFDDIANNIMQEISDNVEYIERFEKYYTRKQLLLEKTKQEKKEEKIKNNIEMAKDKLACLSRDVHKNINYRLDKFHHFDFNKILEYKEKGEKLVKIIIACKVTSRKNASLYYVSRNETLSHSLSNAMVLSEFESIPNSIQKMVDENKIVITEILFPI